MENSLSDSQQRERIRGFVVDVLIKKFLHFGLSREQIAEIAKAVLAKTDNLASLQELDAALQELSVQYPVLKEAELKEEDFEEHQHSEEKTQRLIELLHQGDFESASQLVHQLENTGGDS